MKVIQTDLWLCTDCSMAAINDDYTGLDYYYPEPRSSQIKTLIEKGLERLGVGLVPDWNDQLEWDCPLCKWQGSEPEFVENEPVCPCCHCNDLTERAHGEEAFSYEPCECCGSNHAGQRYRFAIIGD